jgi:hypothetical protein
MGIQEPYQPVRGLDDRALFYFTILVSAVGTIALLVLVSNAAVLTLRFILILKQGRTIYPQATVDRFAAELGPQIPLAPLLYYPVAVRPIDRGQRGVSARNSLFDPWIDARLLAKHTAAINPLIVFPFVLLGLMIVARSRFFDNWDIGFVTVLLGTYLLWAAAMAALLNYGAEIARRKAVEDLERDLLWLQGAGPRYAALVEQFPRIIKQVHDLREGAFAPFFEQPLVRAILVPLGGAGGIQLLEALLLSRAG